MKNFKKIIISLAVLLLILVGVAFYNGVFQHIHAVETKDGGYTLVGLEFKGPYSNAGKYMKEVEEKLEATGISVNKGFGIYYDNPKMVKSENCRSFIGAILETDQLKKIAELRSAGFKVDSVALKSTLSAEFPIKNSFSYMIGPWKVYPVLSRLMHEKNYTTDVTMEIYDIRNKKINFLIQYH